MEHIVLLKLEKVTDELKSSLDNLINIPGVLEFNFAETFTTDRNKEYNYVITAKLETKEHLPIYQKHPLHHKAIEELKLCLKLEGSTVLAVDILTDKTKVSMTIKKSMKGISKPLFIFCGFALIVGLISTR